MKLKILWQNNDVVVVHKPPGLVTYADSPEQNKICCKSRTEIMIRKKVFPIHRLDKDTCGVVAFATSVASARTLSELFRTRVVKKKYLALVHGVPGEKTGKIEFALPKNKSKELEPAHTKFTVLQSKEIEMQGEPRGYSLLLCEPETGKYHQIRRHLKMIGHPIIGDPEYGNTWENDAFEKRFQIHRTLLSAVGLAFPDRAAQKMVRVFSEPEGDFMGILRFFSWEKTNWKTS